MAEATLATLAGDLSFLVSLTLANELLAAAAEAGVSSHELAAAGLVVAVSLASLPRSLRGIKTLLSSDAKSAVTTTGEGKEATNVASPSGLSAFASSLASMARRISVSVAVQLLAATAVSSSSHLAARVLSLLSVVIFFSFLQASARFGS